MGLVIIFYLTKIIKMKIIYWAKKVFRQFLGEVDRNEQKFYLKTFVSDYNLQYAEVWNLEDE